MSLWRWVNNKSSNRTFMELKSKTKLGTSFLDNCSNRTFMELKFCMLLPPMLVFPVLIVPLWNWNYTAVQQSFPQKSVLIVPLWNWNFSELLNGTRISSVLIVPLWNWNGLLWHRDRRGAFVLIVPLWNWNGQMRIGSRYVPRSNRTFMELKSIRRTFNGRACRF